MPRGGAREGAGRPKGSTKERRKARTLVAFDEEWALIHLFSKIAKKDIERAKRIIETE